MPAGLAESRRTAARMRRGAISFSSSSHLPLKLYSKIMNPVTLPPGRASVSTKPAPTGSPTPTNTIGKLRVTRCNAATPRVPADVRRERDQFRRVLPFAVGIVLAPADVDPHIAAVGPAKLLQAVRSEE